MKKETIGAMTDPLITDDEKGVSFGMIELENPIGAKPGDVITVNLEDTYVVYSVSPGGYHLTIITPKSVRNVNWAATYKAEELADIMHRLISGGIPREYVLLRVKE